MKVEASRNPAELLQPREEPFNLPPSLVAAQNSTILRPCFLAVRFVRRDHLNAFSKLSIQRVRVVSLISNQPFWSLVGKTLKESICDKGDFMRRSTLRVNGEWKTSRVCHCHELRALTPLSFTNSVP